MVCIAVAPTSWLHLVPIVDGTADDVRNLIGGPGICENDRRDRDI